MAGYPAIAVLVNAFYEARLSAEAFLRGIEASTWALALFGAFLIWFIVVRLR